MKSQILTVPDAPHIAVLEGPQMVTRLQITTTKRDQMMNITPQIARTLADTGVTSGVVTIFVPHTTAAITINENADPDVVHDVLLGLSELVPQKNSFFRHAEGNSDAHIKASLLGNSVQVLVENGELLLGTWQAVYFCEFDGPRSRRIWVKIAADV